MRWIWPVWQIRASMIPDVVPKGHSMNHRARQRKDDAVEIGRLMNEIEPVDRHQIDAGRVAGNGRGAALTERGLAL